MQQKKVVLQTILFVNRYINKAHQTTDKGLFVTSSGDLYEFNLIKNPCNCYVTPLNDDSFLNILKGIIKNSKPIYKCNKKEIVEAYMLAKQIKANCKMLFKPCASDSGIRSLYFFKDGKLLGLMNDGDIFGVIECNEIMQIYRILKKNHVYSAIHECFFNFELLRGYSINLPKISS